MRFRLRRRRVVFGGVAVAAVLTVQSFAGAAPEAPPEPTGVERRLDVARRGVDEQVRTLAAHLDEGTASVRQRAFAVVSLASPPEARDVRTVVPSDAVNASFLLSLPDGRPLVLTTKHPETALETLTGVLSETQVSSSDTRSLAEAHPTLLDDLATDARIVGYAVPLAALDESSTTVDDVRGVEVSLNPTQQPIVPER